MIVDVYGLNLLSGAAELLDECVDDVDEDGNASESWKDILQSLWKLSRDKGTDVRAGIESLMHQRLAGVGSDYFWEAGQIDWSSVGKTVISIPLDGEGQYNASGECRFVDESELLSWLWLFAALSVPGTRLLGVCNEVNCSLPTYGSMPDDDIYVHWRAAAVRRSSSAELEELPCRILDIVRDGEMSTPLAEWIGKPCADRVNYITGDSSPVSGQYGWVDYTACFGQRVTVFPGELLKSPTFAKRLNQALTEAYSDFEEDEDAFPWHLQVIEGQFVLEDPDSHPNRHAESLSEDRERAELFEVALPTDTMSATPLDGEQLRRLARMVGEALDVGSRALVQMEAMISHGGSDETDYSVTGFIYPVERCSNGVHVLDACKQEVQVYDGQTWILGREWVKGAQKGDPADRDNP